MTPGPLYRFGCAASAKNLAALLDPATLAEYWFESTRAGVLTEGAGVSGTITGDGATATFSAGAGHGFVTGQSVAVTSAKYGGTYTVSVSTASTFTFPSTATGADSGTAVLATTPQISAGVNSGTEGGSLAQATVAKQLQEQANGALRSDGSDDVMSIAAAPSLESAIYFGCLIAPLADQTGASPEQIMFGWGHDVRDRFFVRFGDSTGSNRVSVAVQASPHTWVAGHTGDLTAGQFYWIDCLWTGATPQAWINGSLMTVRAAGSPAVADLGSYGADALNIGESRTVFGAGDLKIGTMAYSDIKAPARAWVSAQHGITL